MRILYSSPMDLGSTAEHRARAMRRSLCSELIELPYGRYLDRGNALLRRLGNRFQLSPGVSALNAALLECAEATRPDLVWLDKPVHFHAATIRRLAATGHRVVAYMPDDPFGPRRDPVWRLYAEALPHYYAHVVPRAVTQTEYRARGVERVACVPFAFEPTVHFPPQALGLRQPKDFDISFIGTPYDQRVDWIINLKRALPQLRFGLYGGPAWDRYNARLAEVGLAGLHPLWNDQYREVIWRSQLSLSFVTRGNRDELSHKAIEAAAAGTAVLVEHSPVHDRVFRDGESALFFDSPAQLPQLVARALADRQASQAIGARGAAAVRAAGLSNDEVLREAFRQLGMPFAVAA
jgi:glycosyltransferase involved in cell wall biosynthesis